jgi:hypothetical protein
MRRALLILLSCCLALASAACRQEADYDPLRPSMNSDTWLGTWTGPEGTSLEIEKDKFAYRLTVTDLDGPRVFRGAAARGGIDFMRDGESLTIRPGSGADTGMKWLAGKHTCLVVAPHEGYCRD